MERARTVGFRNSALSLACSAECEKWTELKKFLKEAVSYVMVFHFLGGDRDAHRYLAHDP